MPLHICFPAECPIMYIAEQAVPETGPDRDLCAQGLMTGKKRIANRVDQSDMKGIVLLAILVAFVMCVAPTPRLSAADRGTAAEAKAMLLKAVTHYKAVGRKQALADFTAKKPPFGDRDLYVVCFDSARVVVANGGFPGHIGTPGDVVVDLHGKGIATAAWEAASPGGDGTVHFRWVHPVSRDVEQKVMFFARMGDDVCGVGTYVTE